MTTPRTGLVLRSVGVVRTGFTLIELLIVIGVIGVLVGVAAVVGTKVLAGGKSRVTEDVLRVLDVALTEYESATNGPAPGMFEKRLPQPNGADRIYQYAILDARVNGPKNYDKVKDLPLPSITRCTAMLNEATSSQAALKQLDSRFAHQSQVDSFSGIQITGIEVVDAWGNPIRAVHPSFDGGYGDLGGSAPSKGRDVARTFTEQRGNGQVKGEYRRSCQPFSDNEKAANPTWVGDADEGMCPGKRVYFYSSGADANPGARADNVYSVRPTFPQESAKY